MGKWYTIRTQWQNRVWINHLWVVIHKLNFSWIVIISWAQFYTKIPQTALNVI